MDSNNPFIRMLIENQEREKRRHDELKRAYEEANKAFEDYKNRITKDRES